MQRMTFHPVSAFYKDLPQVRAVLMAGALALQIFTKTWRVGIHFMFNKGVWSSSMAVAGSWAVREESVFLLPHVAYAIFFPWTVSKVVLHIKSSMWLNFEACGVVAGLVWQCQGTVRAVCSAREGENNAKAGGSWDLTKKQEDVEKHVWLMRRPETVTVQWLHSKSIVMRQVWDQARKPTQQVWVRTEETEGQV